MTEVSRFSHRIIILYYLFFYLFFLSHQIVHAFLHEIPSDRRNNPGIIPSHYRKPFPSFYWIRGKLKNLVSLASPQFFSPSCNYLTVFFLDSKTAGYRQRERFTRELIKYTQFRNVSYLRAYRNIRHNEKFSECGKCFKEEETRQENPGGHFAVSLTKFFVGPYISAYPHVR